MNWTALGPLSVLGTMMMLCICICVAGWPSVEQQRSTGGSSDRHELRTRESSPQTIFQAAMNAQLRASNQPAEALLYTTANGQPYASPYGAQRVGPNGAIPFSLSILLHAG